jgi:hypothetical protein
MKMWLGHLRKQSFHDLQKMMKKQAKKKIRRWLIFQMKLVQRQSLMVRRKRMQGLMKMKEMTIVQKTTVWKLKMVPMQLLQMHQKWVRVQSWQLA